MSTATLPLRDDETRTAMRRRRSKRVLTPVLSIGGLLVVWQLASLLTPLVPSPWVVVQQLIADASYYPANIAVTMSSAAVVNRNQSHDVMPAPPGTAATASARAGSTRRRPSSPAAH